MKIVQRHKGFVFATAGIHPEFIKEISEGEIGNFLERLKENRANIAGIGEVGLDYNWVRENEWREKQKELIRELIRFAKKLGMPLVIHSRDSYEDAVDILEQVGAEQVMMHMFGANQLVHRIIDNGWHVSLNAIVLKSKKHKKVARDMPLDKLMLETDAPWLAPEGWESKRNDPRAVLRVAEKIADIKKIQVDEVIKQTTSNAVEFFKLDIRL